MKTIFGILAVILSINAFAKPENFQVQNHSSVTWEGRKIGDTHTGTLAVSKGVMLFDHGMLSGGEFVIDMSTLTVTHPKDKKNSDRLLNHLKSDDFFSIEKFKTATLKISSVTVNKENNSYTINGDLTIKGIKKPVSFPAIISKNKDGTYLAKASITVDRTDYDIKYKSLKFFSELADKAIKDNFIVNVELIAKK